MDVGGGRGGGRKGARGRADSLLLSGLLCDAAGGVKGGDGEEMERSLAAFSHLRRVKRRSKYEGR